jgi:hypothetical protein
MNRHIGWALTALVGAAIAWAGCSSSSTGPNPEPTDQLVYKPRTCPESVLHNVHKAYENMDAEAYLDCLAEDYVFYLNPDDVDEDPEHPLPEWWDKIEERVIHENMFGKYTDVEGATLVFTHMSQSCDQGQDSIDPLDNLWTFIEGVDLRVQLPPDLTLFADAAGEFLFRVDPDSTGPNGEVLWEILRQWDGSTDGRGFRASHESSWGSIKAMFR